MVFFYSWQLRKRHHFGEYDKQRFGPSYFIRTLLSLIFLTISIYFLQLAAEKKTSFRQAWQTNIWPVLFCHSFSIISNSAEQNWPLYWIGFKGTWLTPGLIIILSTYFLFIFYLEISVANYAYDLTLVAHFDTQDNPWGSKPIANFHW